MTMVYNRLLLITLLLLGSRAFACGFYPRAEELRYNFLKPEYIFPNSGDHFFYTMNMYSYNMEETTSNMFEENCMLWMDALNDKFVYDEVYYAIYQSSIDELKNKNAQNSVIKALQSPQYQAHLNYLLFAKSISYLNTSNYYTEWEFDDKMYTKYVKDRKKAISKALKLANKETNEQLKRRYAHLAIRLAYYNSNEKQTLEIYSKYFKADQYKDVIDYWALYFKLQFGGNTPEEKLQYCQVFLNSKEKRPAVSQQVQYYDFEGVYDLADTDEEKIAYLFYMGCTDAYIGSRYIGEIAEINPSHPCLDFLVLREVNKLEHKVMTTKYLNYEGIQWENSYSADEELANSIKRISIDAEEHAAFLHRILKDITPKRKTNTAWWTIMTDYTEFLSNEGKMNSSEILTNSKKTVYSAEQKKFLEKLYLLTVFHQDEDADLKNASVRSLLMKKEHYTDHKLLLALAKELEFHEHFNTAAVIFSNVNREYSEESMSALWRNDHLTKTIDDDYYYSYFQYLDATYSTYNVQQLIHYLDKVKMTDEFDSKFYGRIVEESNRLYDMLGTKYLRKGDLKSAYAAISKVKDTIWTSGNLPYAQYIHDDPFNNDFYWKTDPRHDDELKKTYTKPEILKELMSLIDQVNTLSGDKKAKAAYRVANCYRNMSYYGNAWMMRRYFWSAYPSQRGFEDDEEYYSCHKAQEYYEIAYENATKKEFRVLALRMQGTCKEYEMLHLLENAYYSYEEMAAIEKLNPLYMKLRENYPEYSYTIEACTGFGKLYKSIE